MAGTPRQMWRVSPIGDEVLAAIDTSIKIEFSEEIDPEIERAICISPVVGFTTAWVPGRPGMEIITRLVVKQHLSTWVGSGRTEV